MGKVKQLQERLGQTGLDAILVTSAYNRRFLAGFTGSSGSALITKDHAFFITDFRYTIQAGEQCKGFEVIEQKGSMQAEAARLAKEAGIKTLGFEEDHVTYSQYKLIKEAVDCELLPVSGEIEKLRLIKTEAEINILKEAARIADAAFTHILGYIKPGLTELQVSNELEFYMRSLGAASSSFDIIVASGYRSALPHGVASEKVIETGDFVTLDFGAYYNGYVSDITRTVAVGEPSDKLKEIYQIVLEAQMKGLEGIKPGITGKQADALTRDHITEKGYGQYFGHSTGHGIGLEVHEGPALSVKSDVILEPGMVVTVEPGIYIPGLGGVRIEDDIILTTDHNERLTHSDKELIIL